MIHSGEELQYAVIRKRAGACQAEEESVRGTDGSEVKIPVKVVFKNIHGLKCREEVQSDDTRRPGTSAESMRLAVQSGFGLVDTSFASGGGGDLLPKIQGYFDGMVDNPLGFINGSPPWDGIFIGSGIVDLPPWEGAQIYLMRPASISLGSITITGRTCCNFYIMQTGLTEWYMWAKPSGGFGPPPDPDRIPLTIWSGVKPTGTTPFGLYTNDGFNINPNPNTLTIVSTPGTFLPAGSSLNYFCLV